MINKIHRKKFPKREHLKSKKLIKELFEKGRSINCFPIRILYLSTITSAFTQVLIVVPKKKIKHAVDRNRIRRQIREAYRSNKLLILQNQESEIQNSIQSIQDEARSRVLPELPVTGETKFKIVSSYVIAIIYISDKKISSHDLESKLILALKRLRT